MASQQSISLDPSVSGSQAPAAPSSSMVPAVLGGIAACGVALIVAKKSSRVFTALADKLPWSKHNRDLKAVQSMNALENECLSDDAIKAARSRRSKERANHKLDLDDIELPDNHPWATKHKVSKEDDDAVTARLSMRRSVRPPQPQQQQARDAFSGDGAPRQQRQSRAGSEPEEPGTLPRRRQQQQSQQ